VDSLKVGESCDRLVSLPIPSQARWETAGKV
jgi:hypothetical protein